VVLTVPSSHCLWLDCGAAGDGKVALAFFCLTSTVAGSLLNHYTKHVPLPPLLLRLTNDVGFSCSTSQLAPVADDSHWPGSGLQFIDVKVFSAAAAATTAVHAITAVLAVLAAAAAAAALMVFPLRVQCI